MLLPRALVILKLLELRGLARRMIKQMKRPAGALFVVAYICMFLPAVLSSLLMRKPPIQLSSDWILRGAPTLIGFLCVMSMLAPEMRIAMNFKPAEIDVLFTGPYSRRHILTYKLMGTVLGSLFMALIFFLASFAFAPTRLPLFVGIYLSILFATMFSTAYSMLIQAVSVRVKYLGYLVAAGVFGALGYAIYGVSTDVSNAAGVQNDPNMIYELVFQHPIVRWVSMPFMPFAHVMAADGGGAAWAMWTTVSVAIIAALYALIVLLDADYMEAAMARSAKQYATLERFKRGHFISARAATRERRWSLPSLPRFGGFGPVAWRQLTGAAHAWGRQVVALYAICIVGGLVLRQYDVGDSVRNASLPALMGVLAYISVIGINFFRFDFRSDIDVIDGLKTLPITARRLAAAQIVAPTVLLSSVYVAFGLGTAIGVNRAGIVPIIGMLAVPFTALMIAVENLVFLLWPTRMAFQGNMDIQHTGRAFFALLVKFLILGPACAIAAGVGLACGFFLESWTLAYVVAACIMAVEAAFTVPAIAAAFEKFDPSTDAPP